MNAGNLTNIATVNGIDEEGNNTHDDDDAVVEVQDVDPTINIVQDRVARPKSRREPRPR